MKLDADAITRILLALVSAVLMSQGYTADRTGRQLRQDNHETRRGERLWRKHLENKLDACLGQATEAP